MSQTREKLEMMKACFVETQRQVYGLEDVSGDEENCITLRGSRCPRREQYRKAGAAHCLAHETMWQRVASSIDPRMSFKVTRSFNWGDDCCEFRLEL